MLGLKLTLGACAVVFGGRTPDAPVNSVAPVISGNAYVGQTLSATTGTWSNVPSSYAYQWLADGSPIGSATSSTYQLLSGQLGALIKVRVTATNAGGSSSSDSSATSAVIATPANTVAPAVTGNAYVGSTLTSSTGTWTGGGSLSYSYQWKVGGVNAGTDQNTYVPISGNVGSTVTCTVTATNAAGSGTPAVSSATAAVIATPANTVAPAISGTTTENQTLTVSNGTWSGGGSQSFGYQWKRDGSSISSATNSTYVLVSADVGTTITCTVTSTNAAGSGNATATGVGPIVAAAKAWNPSDKGIDISLSNSDFKITRTQVGGNGTYRVIRSVTSHASGKWYFEVHVDNKVGEVMVGFADSSATLAGYLGSDSHAGGVTSEGDYWPAGSADIGATTTGDTICVALDLDATNKAWFRKNGGAWSGSGDPAAGTGGRTLPAALQGSTLVFMAAAMTVNLDSGTLNSGNTTFAQTPPTGFSAFG